MFKEITKYLVLILFVLITVACASETRENREADVEVNGNVSENENGNSESVMEIDLATVYHSASPDVAGAERFAELVEEKSDGRITVNIFPDGTLGSERDNFTEVSSGGLDMVLGGAAGIEMFAPEYMFFLTPFLVKDMDHLEAWFESEQHAEMVEIMEENNVHFLGDIVRGARHTTANEPITTPEDLAGLQIRTPENPSMVKVFSGFGAQPTAVALPELYSSLQTGVVEASEGPYEQLAAHNLHEVQDYVIKTSHIFDVTALWINGELFDSLSSEDQQIIEEAGAEAVKYATDRAAESEEEYLNELIDNGMEVIELSEGEQNAFLESAEPTLKELFEEDFTVISYDDFMEMAN